MITTDEKLSIFENFSINRQLPKYQAERSQGFLQGGVSVANLLVMNANNIEKAPERGLGAWAWHYLRHQVLSWWSPPPSPMTIEDFFKSVKDSVEGLEVIQSRAQGYESAIKRAKESHQESLVEKLTSGLETVRSETQLVSIGVNKFLTEDQLVTFVKKCPKGLRLDWVANFTRVIPEDLTEKMKDLNERLIFDNYVILHYDPQGKSWSETEAEKARRKDPVLFGVLKGSRKLYYVGDWIDEFCDLTLDQIAESLGEGSISSIPAQFS